MRKIILVLIIMLVSLICGSGARADQGGGNYELTIDGESHFVELGREYTLKTGAGKDVTLRLDKKAIITYEDELVSFLHKSDIAVSSTEVDEGITQVMANTARGTLVLVQEYVVGFTPMLVPTMVEELTKEQVSYGWDRSRQYLSKQSKDKKTLSGEKVVVKYEGEEKYYQVLSYGKDGRGVLVITMIDKEYLKDDGHLLDLLWDSLSLKF